MDVGLLLLRVALGAVLMGHGTQKLFGWFGGHGIEGTSQFFGSLGHRPPKQMAIVAGLSEAGGGLLLVLGFLDPLGSAIVVGVMIVAASTHWPAFWVTDNGAELPIFYAVTAAALGLTGPGRVSIDNAIGWGYGYPLRLGPIAIGVPGANGGGGGG